MRGDRIAAFDQYEAEVRDVSTMVQAYIDKLDKQIAWHRKWDKWIVRATSVAAYVTLMLLLGWFFNRFGGTA